MKKPSQAEIERRKKQFPKGTRVELFWMEDQHALPVGTRGTVQGVDDVWGDLEVDWDNGSHLKVVLEVDQVRVI